MLAVQCAKTAEYEESSDRDADYPVDDFEEAPGQDNAEKQPGNYGQRSEQQYNDASSANEAVALDKEERGGKSKQNEAEPAGKTAEKADGSAKEKEYRGENIRAQALDKSRFTVVHKNTSGSIIVTRDGYDAVLAALPSKKNYIIFVFLFQGSIMTFL